ncbi:(2Fe-2S)-binding protein [Rhodobacteraceae bacterium N5(2021)]|uniref:(2Fe-2S)-binding protein n=1 Tax=Gymnodinialimonas phycosphaerae TaxID=2841589 RepID=A0A975TVP2_9RHOB|nr:2Fe-2S iron-sulfur cluster-binding protein [Gymnodinialimonas phycosphaerae]MBY4891339.1 (2Fe-2S)-binding protein [Gymnodinialimonas phycosphaerae]
MTGWRHPTLGSEIDRTKPLRAKVDWEVIDGFQGDTLASALLASGPRTIARSFKYHRPRGVMGFGAEEPNALFDVTRNGTTTPNARATLVPLTDGLKARAVNAQPTAQKDRARWLDLLHRAIPAGFYYKTFIAGGWHLYEPRIRKMAGLGQLDPTTTPHADTPIRHARCDTLVIGGGVAGLMAARTALETGGTVWLIEQSRHLGGTLRWRGGEVDGQAWPDFVEDTRKAILASGGRILINTNAWGAFDHGLIAAYQRYVTDIHWQIRPLNTVLATGATERPLWPAGNDIPGVILAEAAHHYLMLYGAVVGRRILLATGSDASYATAAALAEAGADVTLADRRAKTPPAPEGVLLLKSQQLQSVQGRTEMFGATFNDTFLTADTLLMSGGWTPSVQLHCQSGGKLDWDADKDALVPRPGTGHMRVVGAANGTFGLAATLIEAGLPPQTGPDWHWETARPNPLIKGRVWIDFQNDVTLKDVTLAAREGFTSVEHLKRYTTLGMATDQGRTSNFAGLAAMSEATDRTIPETGTTTFRPPVQPIPFTVIAGRRRGDLFNPLKRLTLEGQHKSRGAQFREYGGWLRPSAYGDDERSSAQTEAKVARETVGIYDASPLGKLDVIGPGAAALLDFAFYTRLSTLKPGRARYALMLRENGIVFDDGVVMRVAEDHYVVSASSSHAEAVRFVLEDPRQDRFDPGRVAIHDVTQAWTTLTVTGPRAKALLDAAGLPVDCPAMGLTRSTWNDMPVRIARISLTGDISFEVSVPTSDGAALHAALEAARIKVGGHWIGLEAVMILRAEKGYIVVGKDTDGSTMPHDLGWGGPRLKRSDAYLGKQSLFTEAATALDRRQLIGLESAEVLATGAHLVPLDGPRRSLGFVTSSYMSPNLNRPIALAMVEAGHGSEVGIFHDGTVTRARVTPACAFDPKGERL